MNNGQNVLAWRKKPEPNGKIYSSDDLLSKESVIELFAACQISEAYITSDGWAFLFSSYEMEQLLEIDKVSGWFDASESKAQRSDLIYHSLMSGFNPIDRVMGDYDEETKYFLTLDGYKTKIDWDNV